MHGSGNKLFYNIVEWRGEIKNRTDEDGMGVGHTWARGVPSSWRPKSESPSLPGSYVVNHTHTLLWRIFVGIFLKTYQKPFFKSAKFSLLLKKFYFWALFDDFSSCIPPSPLLKPKVLSLPWSQNICPPLPDRFLPPSCLQSPRPSMEWVLCGLVG